MPVATAFAYVADYRTIPDWFYGVSRFVPEGDLDHGLGARFAVDLKVGPKVRRSVVEVTGFESDRLIALQSMGSLKAVSTWSFEEAPGGTRMQVEFSYDLPGGLAGKALGRIIEPFAAQAVRSTEATLRRNLEQSAG